MTQPDQRPENDGIEGEVQERPPAFADRAAFASTAPDWVGKPRVVGPYRVVHRLGVGGMGEVWLAEQTRPVRRRVALKLIRAGMVDQALAQRFQAECQSLAIMEHPAIARVFDAGATSDGQPYLAMEYVDGPPITEYCDRRKLGIRERLKLFVQVCEGVQHAHQKAIIHRDLKPSNILVTEIDGQPRPLIIDFGLAKTMAPHALGETMFTQVGGFVGTPGYMSPEQADASIHNIDTRTDVYSLGVILYELLTGVLPFDTEEWKKQTLDEILRQLRDTDPDRPSTKIGKEPDSSTARAEARAANPGRLVSELRGDLDWIALKALEKERDRRYPTPSALAADVANYLASRPIEARPASAVYRLRKYVRRHALAVGVAAAAAALLIAFAVTQSFELRRITRERDRADRITEFMTSMFKVSDPSQARGNTITAREILDRSAKEIDAGLAKDPELKAQMLQVMAAVYEGLGLYARSEVLLRQSAELRHHLLGNHHSDTIETDRQLGWVISEQNRYAEAEKLEREVLQIAVRQLGPNHRITLATQSDLSRTIGLAGHFAESETLCRQVLERQQRVLGPDDPDTLESERRLALVELQKGQFAEAEKDFRVNLARRSRIFGPENPRTLVLVDDLASVLVDEGHYPEAERLYRQTIDTETRILGADNPTVLNVTLNLATVLESENRYPESERLQREVLARFRRVLGSEHPSTALSLFNLADVLYEEHRYRDAIAYLREALGIQRRILGSQHPDTVESTYDLARLLALTGNRDESLALLREAVSNGLSEQSLNDLVKSGNWKLLQNDPNFEALVGMAKQHALADGRPTKE